MSNTKNVTASKPGDPAGAIRIAPYGTTLPTDTSSTLPEAWKTLGYISEDGITNSNGPESTSTKAFGGATVFNGESSKTDTWKWSMLESLNTDVLKLVYGAENVVVSDDGTITVHANSMEHEAWSFCIDEILIDKRKKRTVIANGTLTEMEDITIQDGEPTAFGVTISAQEDSKHQVTTTAGDTYYDTHVTYYSAVS